MRRTVVCLVLAVAAAAACSRTPDPRGPTGPAPIRMITLDDLRLSGQARSVALAFLRAYARSPADDGRSLRPLMGGLRAERWAHWLQVQNEAFPGTLQGTLQLGHLGPALPVRAEDGSLDGSLAYGVAVRATVVFEVTGEDGESLPPLHRVTDGLIVLVRGSDEAFRVLSFDRDGLRLDQFFQVFEGARDRRDGVTVSVRTLLHMDQWQFGIEITNGTRGRLRLLPGLTALLTDAAEPATDGRPIVTFARSIAPGETVEGFVTFAAPTQTMNLDLQVAFEDAHGDTTGFVFGLPTPPGPEQAGVASGAASAAP